jgi:hypothetical protein
VCAVALPNDWLPERDRQEFGKWLDIFRGLVETAPADWVVWTQTRDTQEILAALARRLGFGRGPIERRGEKIVIAGERGRELQDRNYVVAVGPDGGQERKGVR